MPTYLVQIGFAGDYFAARPGPIAHGVEQNDSSLTTADSISVGSEVLVRTPRGIELGVVASLLTDSDDTRPASQCVTILRVIEQADRWLIERLRKNKIEAVRACQDALAASDSNAILLDVDQLIDGGTLILHFLGDPDEIGKRLTDKIVQRYEETVQSIPLSDLIRTGCGPDCGTEYASGQACEGCTSCALKNACG